MLAAHLIDEDFKADGHTRKSLWRLQQVWRGWGQGVGSKTKAAKLTFDQSWRSCYCTNHNRRSGNPVYTETNMKDQIGPKRA